MMHVLAYDIADDNVRARVANRLLSVGYRLQRSVFQLEGPPEVVDRILAEMGSLISDDHDTVHLFRICDRCDVHRAALGQGSVDRPPTHWNV